MMTQENNDYHYIEGERKVLELYSQGKTCFLCFVVVEVPVLHRLHVCCDLYSVFRWKSTSSEGRGTIFIVWIMGL